MVVINPITRWDFSLAFWPSAIAQARQNCPLCQLAAATSGQFTMSFHEDKKSVKAERGDPEHLGEVDVCSLYSFPSVIRLFKLINSAMCRAII
jgi:hypothetical protein